MPTKDSRSDEERFSPPANTLSIHQLYPEPSNRGDFTIDVVAVHGLGGDAYSTWTTDGTLWLRDLLPASPLFGNARILTFGYDARAFLHPFARATTGRTFTFAESLLNDLADKRVSAAARMRPIVFVGHSLGGIVIKSALRHARALFGQFGDILKATKAIIFFGTPHQGSDTATWATRLDGIGRAFRLRNTEVTEELRRWSSPLVELTTVFSDLAPDILISTFCENRATHGVVVVPEGSARMGQRNERVRVLEADHLSVCKFTATDPNWEPVLARMEAVAEEIEDGLRVTFQIPQLPNVPNTRGLDSTEGCAQGGAAETRLKGYTA